jgi:pyruvate/2-oxoglutarate dehydrogenase complex dihydrolipoamide dehydrogenase (E3) component
LRGQNQKYAVFRFPFARLDRAITESATDGEVKVLADRRINSLPNSSIRRCGL